MKKTKEETGKPVKKEKNGSGNLLEGSQNRLASWVVVYITGDAHSVAARSLACA